VPTPINLQGGLRHLDFTGYSSETELGMQGELALQDVGNLTRKLVKLREFNSS
jgi:hypothetical protein